MDPSTQEAERYVPHVVEDLADEFGRIISREQVEELVTECFGELSASRIKAFVPILARRCARDRLREIGRSLVA